MPANSDKSDGITTAERIMQAEDLVYKRSLTQYEAAEVMGISQSAVSQLLQKTPRANMVRKAWEDHVLDHYMDLQALKADAVGIPKLAQKIEIQLAILDREMKLLGTAAPTRTVSHSTTVNLDEVDPATLPEYRRWLYETRFMDAATKEKAFQLIRESGLNKREPLTIEPPDSSPLWNTPKLTEGGTE